jgi:hypothetical protein
MDNKIMIIPEIKEFIITKEELRKRLVINPHFELLDKQYIKDLMTAELINDIFVLSQQEATITKTFNIEIEPPKFTDWLFKKKRVKTITKLFKLTAKDVLLDPPIDIPNKETIRLFNYKSIDFLDE